MSAAVHMRGAPFEVRAVWTFADGHCESQAVRQFDRQPLHVRAPDAFGVYEVCGGNVEDHPDRASADAHCSRLNGGEQS